MTEPILQCPACGSSDVVQGRLNHGRPGTFTPEGLRFWTLTVVTLPLINPNDPDAKQMTGTAHACAACGLVWSHVDAERLRTVLRDAGTESTRERRTAPEDGEPPA